MKKIVILLFLFVFVFQLSAFSQDMTKEEIEAKIKKIESEIARLNKKLEATQSETRKERLKALIAGHKANMNKLKGYLVEGKEKYKTEVVAIEIMKVPPKPYFLISAGLGGGALMIQGSYNHPLTQNFFLGGGAGYAMGKDNSYNVVKAGLQGLYNFEPIFLGAEASYVKYSDNVTEVPGLSGTITSEDKFGFGIIVGTEFKPITIQAGYNTALGITADVGYKIEF